MMQTRIIAVSIFFMLGAAFTGCSTLEEVLQAVDDNAHKNAFTSEKQSSEEVFSYETPNMKTRRANWMIFRSLNIRK